MNNLYVRLAKNNLKNNKSLYVPYMVAGMITVLMFYIMMFINNSAGLEKMLRSLLYYNNHVVWCDCGRRFLVYLYFLYKQLYQ